MRNLKDINEHFKLAILLLLLKIKKKKHLNLSFFHKYMANQQQTLPDYDEIIREYEKTEREINEMQETKSLYSKSLHKLIIRYNNKQQELIDLDQIIKEQNQKEDEEKEVSKTKEKKTSKKYRKTEKQINEEISPIEKKISELKQENSNLEEKIAQLKQQNTQNSAIYQLSKQIALQNERSGF